MITKEEIDKAIESHQNWRSRLLAVVELNESGDQKLTSKSAQDFRLCEFGQWLLNTQDINDPLFGMIKMEHENFHKLSHAILLRYESQDFIGAQSLLGANGQFMESTFKLVALLYKFKKKCS